MKKFLRFMFILLGIGIGPLVVFLINNLLVSLNFVSIFMAFDPMINLVIFVAAGFITGIIFIFLSKSLSQIVYEKIVKLENTMSNVSAPIVFSGVLGFVIGLIIAFLISALFSTIGVPWVSTIFSIITYIVFGYLGIKLGVRRRQDMNFFSFGKRNRERERNLQASPKILDTSVIIDGRIFDLCKCGFIEGNLVIPEFVLAELRHIADSADSLKRARGRRGLDMLAKIQKELNLSLTISDVDYEDTNEVDLKLLKLAKEMDGKVVTNDYNLNKVASVQEVRVLNINELANAIKPVVLSGEEMIVSVIKDGKEPGQGIAYLDDGTMIVVEGGRGREGEALRVVVTSVLQTAAGRMIFTRIQGEEE